MVDGRNTLVEKFRQSLPFPVGDKGLHHPEHRLRRHGQVGDEPAKSEPAMGNNPAAMQ